MPKREVADKILDKVVALLRGGKMLSTCLESFVICLYPAYLKEYYIHIPKKKKHLFPEPPSQILLEYGTEIYQARVKSDSHGGSYIGRFPEWFEAHPEVKVGDKLVIEVMDPLKHYCLKIA